MLLHPALPILAQEIETKAIPFLVKGLQQALAQPGPLSRVHDTFENRILHPLPEVLANLGNPAKAARTTLILETHIIAH